MVKKQIKRKVKQRPQQKSWINSSLSLNNNHRTLIKRNDVFKTNSKNIMSNMFKDSDKDGVLNVFDCKPRNKNEQGLIDAAVRVFKKRDKKKTYAEVSTKKMTPAQLQAFTKKNAALNRAKKGMKIQKQRAVKATGKKITRGVTQAGNRLALAVTRANPKYDMQLEKRHTGLTPMTKLQRKKLNLKYEQMRQAKVSRQQLVGGGGSPRANTLSRSIGMVFPQAQPKTASGKAVGVPGQRGRPRGSLDPRYAAYGGVFQYRKAMALKKKAAKFAKQQAELQAKMSGQPQYETQQYQEEEVPQETPGAVPDYEQFQDAQQQHLQEQVESGAEVIYEQAPQQQQVVYQQPQPQQYSQDPSQRPIRPVFKSSGGSPYGTRAAVVQGSLQPSNADEDYIEYADAFTGERKWKKKVKPEGWSRPSGPNQEPIVKQSWMGNR